MVGAFIAPSRGSVNKTCHTREMTETTLPECVPVLMAEQLIFYLAAGGLLLLVSGPEWTVPPMPASALLAGLLAYLVSLGVLFARIALSNHAKDTLARMQKLAMAWIFAYTLQYVVFALILRLQERGDATGGIDDIFILMFNAERVQPYGLGATTLHMVVSLVLSTLLLALFTSVHYFLRVREAPGVETPLLMFLFFVESQFFLFHTEDQAAAVRENERCTHVVCDVLHAVVALGVLAGLMTEHFAMDVVLQRFQNTKKPQPLLFLVYVLLHVLAVPVTGFVAVHVVSWLQEPGLYVANLVFISLLLLTRVHAAWKEWQKFRASLHLGKIPTMEEKTAPFSQQTFVSGTKQPRYFLKRMNESGKTQRKKHE